MGLQKFRADESEALASGAILWRARWVGGPTLSKVTNCPTMFGPRTVYVTGHADTYFSLPAACVVQGKTVRGFLTFEDGAPCFWAYLPDHIPTLDAHTSVLCHVRMRVEERYIAPAEMVGWSVTPEVLAELGRE